MKLYNATTDTLIMNVRPYYSKGFVSHYIAKDVDTGKKVKLSLKELKEFQTLDKVDITYFRDKDAFEDMDEFVVKSMC